MKATCDREDLLHSVLTVSRALPGRSPNEILENIHLAARDGALRLRCTDSVLSIEDSLPAFIETEGEIVLPGRLFMEIVRRLPQGSVDIEVKDLQIHLRCALTDMTLRGLDGALFPQLPALVDAKPFTLAQNLLKGLIVQTNFAISQEESQPILTGELVEAGDEGINMVALDGYRMAIARHTGGVGVNVAAVLPGKALNEIARLLDESEDAVTIHIDRSQAAIEINHTRIVTRLLEGEFINYRQILPADYQTRIHVNTQAFADAVERASLLVREGRNNLIKISVDESTVVVSSNGERGHLTESVDVAYMEGKALTIAFNAKYLHDVLRAVRDEDVMMDFISDRSPCSIRPLEGDAFLFIVLPVRLTA
jgi:DNA polymerase-3 subunit beta